MTYWKLLPETETHDVDQNGVTNAADGQAVLDKHTGLWPADAAFDEAAADLDGDGAVSSCDAYLLFRFAADAELDQNKGKLPTGWP